MVRNWKIQTTNLGTPTIRVAIPSTITFPTVGSGVAMVLVSSASTFQTALRMYPMTQTGTFNGITYRYADIPAPNTGDFLSFATVNPYLTITSPANNTIFNTGTISFAGSGYVR